MRSIGSHIFPVLRIFILIFTMAGCKSSSDITATDISSMYSDNRETTLRIQDLFHINDSTSVIYTIVPANQEGVLRFTRKNGNGKLQYNVYKPGKQISLVDSAGFAIYDSLVRDHPMIHKWSFNAPTGSDYMIKLSYLPAGSRNAINLLTELDKLNSISAGWFRFQDEKGEFLNGNIATTAQPCRLICSPQQDGLYTVKLYSRDFEVPYPPFSETKRSSFNYLSDSTFSISIQNGVSELFTPDRHGFYFFQKDTVQKQGVVLFRMNSGFPHISDYTEMIESLRYITSSKEFNQLLQNPFPKLAVDSFWIANTGRPDLASELIKRYYGRVEICNELFSSFTEGWRTDRGMIYIIFGKPTQVFRSFDQEVWVYGESVNPSSLKFFFIKAVNPFTNNDFVLTRRDFYKSMWYQYVQAWRR